LLVLAACRQAQALARVDLTPAEVSSDLKAVLEKGRLTAAGPAGRTDGFLGNPKVRIGLPATWKTPRND